MINEFAKLDVAGVWGTGHVAGTDGSQIGTWENNILAESIRYGGYGGLAMRHISDTRRLVQSLHPCGVWEAVYIIEGLLRNESDIQPDTIHADTQGQSLPVFGLATRHCWGSTPATRIRNSGEQNFYRADPQALYQHIDSLFGDNTIDWGLIEAHFPDLLRTAISIPGRAGCHR